LQDMWRRLKSPLSAFWVGIGVPEAPLPKPWPGQSRLESVGFADDAGLVIGFKLHQGTTRLGREPRGGLSG
jgi:hypothetical protein